MRYGFINNFSQLLAAELAAGATTMTLDGGGSLLNNASADMVYTLTLFDVTSGENEIVHVTAASGNELTVTRGEEGTTDAAWPTGTPVEMRVTAAALSGGVFTDADGNISSMPVNGPAQIAQGVEWAVALGDYVTAESFGVAIGDGTEVATYGVAVGAGAKTWEEESVAIGKYCSSIGSRATTINTNWTNVGEQAVALGWWALIGAETPDADFSVAIGSSATASADNAVVVGNHAYARPNAENSVAIGVGARASVKGGFRLNAIPYLSADPDSDEIDAVNAGFLDAVATQDAISRRVSQQVVIETDPLDLTDDTAAVTLDLPAGTMLFLDSIDVVVVGSDTPGGSPEITVGPDDVTPAAYLAATAVGKTAVGGRETHDPLVLDGVTNLRVAVETAGTGTTYQAKVVFRGYVMEL